MSKTLEKLMTTGHERLREALLLAEETIPHVLNINRDDSSIKNQKTIKLSKGTLSAHIEEELQIHTQTKQLFSHVQIDIIPMDYEIRMNNISYNKYTLELEKTNINIVYLLVKQLKETIKKLEIKKYILKEKSSLNGYNIEVLGVDKKHQTFSINVSVGSQYGYDYDCSASHPVLFNLKKYLKKMRRHSDKTRLSIYRDIDALKYPLHSMLHKTPSKLKRNLVDLGIESPKITYNIITVLNFIKANDIISLAPDRKSMEKIMFDTIELSINCKIDNQIQLKLLIMLSLFSVEEEYYGISQKTVNQKVELFNNALLNSLIDIKDTCGFSHYLKKKEVIDMINLLGKVKEDKGYTNFRNAFTETLKLVEKSIN